MNSTITALPGVAPVTTAVGIPSTGNTAPAGGDFGKMMSDLLSDTATAMSSAEATAIKGLEGKASIQQVVDSVMHAERQLHTVLALRDKVVSAYLEINRMTI